MKLNSTFVFLLFLTAISHSQTVVFDDNFDTYTVGQGVANQSPVWETWLSTTGGGPDDALASDEHALSGLNAMKMINGKDMIYPFDAVTSGAYTIEFNAFMHEQAYFNLQHDKSSNWAVDIYLTANNEIKYLEEDGIVNSQIVGSYVNDQWTHFKFHVDIDADTIFFIVDGIVLHSSKFSNSLDNAPSNTLDVVNFYGLSGFNGVTNSYFYIDDFKVTDIAGFTAVETNPPLAITIFPNPAKELLTIQSDEELKNIILFDLTGKIIYEQTLTGTNFQLPLSGYAPGIYTVNVENSSAIISQNIIIN